jgi:hypothetical protein
MTTKHSLVPLVVGFNTPLHSHVSGSQKNDSSRGRSLDTALAGTLQNPASSKQAPRLPIRYRRMSPLAFIKGEKFNEVIGAVSQSPPQSISKARERPWHRNHKSAFSSSAGGGPNRAICEG